MLGLTSSSHRLAVPFRGSMDPTGFLILRQLVSSHGWLAQLYRASCLKPKTQASYAHCSVSWL